MSLYGNSLRNDLISLNDLAYLEAGGQKQHYERCLNEVAKEFPSGDNRLIGFTQPHMESLISDSEALKYWNAKYKNIPAPSRIADPTTTENWKKLVEALKADNDRLRGLAAVVSVESLPVNATDNMRLCIEVSNRYWTEASREDNSNWNTVKQIEEWIAGKDNRLTKARVTAIQQITRPKWASTGGRPTTEN